ncbi:MAG: Wzz/FepE/Etk N-terminal domain-containing protein [Paracoccaceae bacterium]
MDLTSILHQALSLLERRFALIVAIVFLGTLGGVIFALTKPPIYTATAVLQLELPAAATATASASGDDELLNAATINRRLSQVQQKLTTRQTLVALIERFRIFADLPALTEDERIAIMRENLTLNRIAAAPGPAADGPVTAVSVRASFGDPDLAATLANEFARMIVDNNEALRDRDGRDQLEFFRAEEARISTDIAAVEARISHFKNENTDALPGALDDLREQRGLLEGGLQELDLDIIRLRGEISALDQGSALRALSQHRLAQLESQIGMLSDQRGVLESRRGEIDMAIAALPERERRLSEFDRELQQLRARYDVVTKLLAQAETAERMSAEQQTEKFLFIEEAVPPVYPSSSPRKKIAAMGLAGSLGLAVGLAFLLDLLRPTLRTAAQLESKLGLVPLVAVPFVSNPADARRARLRRLASMALFSALGLFAMTLASHGMGL